MSARLVLSEARRGGFPRSDGHQHVSVPLGLHKPLHLRLHLHCVGLQTSLLYKDPSIRVEAHPVSCSRTPPSSGVAIFTKSHPEVLGVRPSTLGFGWTATTPDSPVVLLLFLSQTIHANLRLLAGWPFLWMVVVQSQLSAFRAAVICKGESSSMAFNSEPEILGVVISRKPQVIKSIVLLSWRWCWPGSA